MRYIEATERYIAFCCGKVVLVYQQGCEATILNLPVPDTSPKSEVKALCLKQSPDGKYLAVACESKVVTVWCTQTWTLLWTHGLVKRPTAIDITSDSTDLIIADKTGDVFLRPLKADTPSNDKSNPTSGDTSEEQSPEDKAESESLLGHLSMLLDVAVTSNKRYVITCDRDEKIRISHYPNAYNIESFCLEHTEFVSQIELLPRKDPLLLSCSGDGTLKLWNYLSGQCLSTANTHEHIKSYLHHFEEYCEEKVKDSEEAKRFLPDHPAVKDFAISGSTQDVERHVAIIIDRVPAVLLYKLDAKKLQYVSTTDTKDIFPVVVTWLQSEELLVEQNSEDCPLRIFRLQRNMLTLIDQHPLISFGQEHKEYFKEGKKELSIDILYKQRYDNVADYLKKKQERLEIEKKVEAGLKPTVKKGRWS